VPVVQGRIRRAAGRKVAYVQLAGFSEGAHGELRSEIERLYRQGAEGLVLDLRGNGGGLLNEAVLTSSVFVDKGVIVSTSGRTQPDKDYQAVGGALDPRPTVVLINRDTASAAEILTAALEEHGLATVVGTRSFGKGVFQEVIDLDSGGALDLTVGEYLTSKGRSLAGNGIKPDVPAKDNLKTRDDEGLERALEVLGRELRQQQ
jgi:carboxyl-terminal processing protease